MATQIKEAMVGKQLTFPDGSRIVLLGDRLCFEHDKCFYPLKIERVKSSKSMIKKR